MRKLLGTLMLAAVLAGCGDSSEPETQTAATPTATAEPPSENEHGLEGYSPGVIEYYGQPHEHADDDAGSIEAEYHQPPNRPRRSWVRRSRSRARRSACGSTSRSPTSSRSKTT